MDLFPKTYLCSLIIYGNISSYGCKVFLVSLNDVGEEMHYGVKRDTIRNICQYVYTYNILSGLKDFAGDVVFIYGSKEPYPRKCARLSKDYKPDMKIKEIEGTGHVQFLSSKPQEYVSIPKEHIEC